MKFKLSMSLQKSDNFPKFLQGSDRFLAQKMPFRRAYYLSANESL